MLTRTSSDPKRVPIRSATVSRAGDAAEKEAEKAAASSAPVRPQASPEGEIPAPAAATDLGPGRPLDPGLCAALEPRFGHDFGQVRVHDDARAAEAARSVDALEIAAAAKALKEQLAAHPDGYVSIAGWWS